MPAARFFPIIAVLLAVLSPVRCPAALADDLIGTGPLPLFFIANRGQLDSEVKYTLQTGDRIFYFTSHGVTMVLSSHSKVMAVRSLPGILAASREQSRYWAARLDFVAANPLTAPHGRAPLPTTFSYFRGSPGQWHTAVPTFSEVVYEGVWPGIDLVFSAGHDQLKYTFIVHPGAEPNRIRLAYHGAEISLNDAGELRVDTPAGDMVDQAPIAWQDGLIPGRRMVPCSYALEKKDDSGYQGYGFRVGSYDATLPLVLDPGFIIYSRLIGGGDDDEGNGIAIDGEGNAYVTGRTRSAVFPRTVGPLYAGSSDAFVAKISPDGTQLLYCCLLGGSGADTGKSIAVDSTGYATVTGYTASDGFPSTVGRPHAGGIDAFAAKINPDGSNLVYSGFLGGSSDDLGFDIAVDDLGNAYLIGRTESVDFPRNVGRALMGSADVFVAKIKPDGSDVYYSGLLGGSGYDVGHGIAVDSSGNAYITGRTSSDDFPTTVGPAYAGTNDVFVAKIRPTGTALLYSRYVGGSDYDQGWSIAVDSAGNAYITGDTASADFFRSGGPLHAGDDDVFVARIKPDGTGLVSGRFLGGSSYEEGLDIAVDSAGNIYITGYTASTDFLRTGGPPLAGDEDVFVAKIKPDGVNLFYSGLLGGSGYNWGNSIVVDNLGNAYITGETSSVEFVSTVGPDHAGGSDAFVAKVRPAFPWILFSPAMNRQNR